jgi:glycogen operon protein
VSKTPVDPHLLAGHPFPLGAHPEAGGTRFAVASTSAESIEVCLIAGDGSERRVELPEQTFGIFHGVVAGVTPGQRYGFRVHGPYEPARGVRANPAKLLVDPYALRIDGTLTDESAAMSYVGDPMGTELSTVDSLGSVPLSVVTSPGGPDTGARPFVPFEETVILELHVRGFTRNHPEVPEEQRGTYLGLAHPAVIEYLVSLGVTAVELLPVQSKLTEPGLRASGGENYWGYSTLGFFAPYAGYASRPGQEVQEFRTMVSALHAAGIEVIMDVVYNHTCEGGAGGPTLSFRGLDAPAYYVLDEHGNDYDITGVGNTLDAESPTVVRMVTDSLRYWAGELGVDGFRFDLASVLGRPGGREFTPDSGLLTAIASDPLLASTKLIAEPWDATGDGYRVGAFGPQWTEWNGRYRDSVRDFWRGAVGVRDLAFRLSGSSDLYGERRPWASINFITAHDGFTLRDLVSYNDKHNEANGEGNRDGTNDNLSWNCGAEGEVSGSDDRAVEIRALRARQARNLMATLLLSTGTPMITAGDERWRTQGGNNNAYCIDDATTWLAWQENPEMLEFTRRVVALRASSPALRQPEFFEGRQTESGNPDLVWLTENGVEMTDEEWFDEDRRTLLMWIDGADSRSRTRTGEMVRDHSWLLALHSGHEPTVLTLPGPDYGKSFEPVLDTGSASGAPIRSAPHAPGAHVEIPARSLLLLRALDS